MSQAAEENEFRLGLEKLLADIKAELAPVVDGPYEEGSQQLILEHGTRLFFLDRFLSLLGWSLGLGGDVAEEARIKANTTRFIDYVGLKDETRAPVLIIEAKAWDKPFVRAAVGKPAATEKQLIVEALKHLNAEGDRAGSPVVGEWHDYLEQLAHYVKTSSTEYGHDVPCAVLTSGQWFVIFTLPVKTFVETRVNEEHIRIFKDEQILDEAEAVFHLLSRRQLGKIVPAHIRPTQITDHLTAATTSAVFHAVLVSYVSTGATFFAKVPQIEVYPAVMLQRDDGTLFTVLDGPQRDQMQLDKANDDGVKLLTSHLAKIGAQADALLEACSAALETPLQPFAITDFPGFQQQGSAEADLRLGRGTAAKTFVRATKGAANEWLIVTGARSHYLSNLPALDCRFHEWGECRSEGQEIGPAAISTPVTGKDRAFFTDGLKYHCAHQSVADRRAERCHIAPLDTRTCCNACALHNVCWAPPDVGQLPCGA